MSRPSTERVAHRWLVADDDDDDDWFLKMFDPDADDDDDEPSRGPSRSREPKPPPGPSEQEVRRKRGVVRNFAARVANLRNWDLVYKMPPLEFGRPDRTAPRRVWEIETPPLKDVLASTVDKSERPVEEYPVALLLVEVGSSNYYVLGMPKQWANQIRADYSKIRVGGGYSFSDFARGQRKAVAGAKDWWLEYGGSLAEGEPKWVVMRL